MRSRSEAWVSALAAEPAEAEDDQLAARHRPCALSNSRDAASASDDRGLGDPRIAFGDVERVAVRGDQLDAEREAALVDPPPHAVERQRR
jgi:hypothetical protein